MGENFWELNGLLAEYYSNPRVIMISHKCYSNPRVLMMRSKASKDSSCGFQVSSKISFLISVRKVLPTSGQILM